MRIKDVCAGIEMMISHLTV